MAHIKEHLPENGHKMWPKRVAGYTVYTKGKSVPLQACSGPEGSRKLRFLDFVTTAQDGGRLSALRTDRLYPRACNGTDLPFFSL